MSFLQPVLSRAVIAKIKYSAFLVSMKYQVQCVPMIFAITFRICFFFTFCTICIMPACAQTPAAMQSAGPPPAHSIWLDSLDVTKMTAGYGSATARLSIVGKPLRLGGVTYSHGIGTHAISQFYVNLHGAARRFVSMVGVDDETSDNGALAQPGKNGSVTFAVIVDGKTILKTPVMHGGDTPRLVDVDLSGAKMLVLKVGDGGDGISWDHADWAGAMIFLAANTSAIPTAISAPVIAPRLIIPAVDTKPAIHGPRIVGSTPGRQFIFLIPATGKGPLHYTAKGLPDGLHLNSITGVIAGSLKKPGMVTVTLMVHGPRGNAKRNLTIVGGANKLALTPPMGWNSWYSYGANVNRTDIKTSADAMVSSGLTRHGYQYINIDDGWAGSRDAQGNIQTNNRFSDMKALADDIHGMGLKFGIYSSPGPKTCGGYEGSYGHEEQDARTYASWGVDFFKYDWCSYSQVVNNDLSLENLKKPYSVMREALDKVNRDIVYSFCQYGMGDVWEWGEQIGGNLWRTCDDLQDVWYIPRTNGGGWTPGSLLTVIQQMAEINKYANPGHWNDPDMLSVGMFNWGDKHKTRLTPDEQILQFSMWSMSCSPLLIGGDITKLDQFTLALLTNDEVIDIDQDPLGRAAKRVALDGSRSVWVRPLFDGTKAAALVNVDDSPAKIQAKWSDIGISGRQSVRDLWLHKNVGYFNGSYEVEVPAHGCVLLKIGQPRK
jgi:alpha-galactosidase